MKVQQAELIRACEECGTMYATDEPYKTLCYKCWLKQANPDAYRSKFELHEIVCEECGEVFVDEAWKKTCFRCWLAGYNTKKLNEFEEREQYK